MREIRLFICFWHIWLSLSHPTNHINDATDNTRPNVKTDFLLHTVTRTTSTAVYSRTPIMADFVVDKSFPAESLVPKHETGVTQFLKKYPAYNGQGVTVAIFDSGVDPKACGLEVNTPYHVITPFPKYSDFLIHAKPNNGCGACCC